MVRVRTMVCFEDILEKYRKEALSKKAYGTKFEELMVGFLQTYPMYDGLFASVNLWMDFPYRTQFGSGQDVGIDIVAKTVTGEYWAVQCKMYARDAIVSRNDLNSFIVTSGQKFTDSDGKLQTFSTRLLISTTDEIGSNAIALIKNQDPPVSTLTYGNLLDAEVDWDALENNIHGKSARRPKHELRPHQVKAVNLALEHYKTNDRGKLIMACGTGKTFTALRIMEALHDQDSDGNGCVLFLAPSISLVGQTMREWMNQTMHPITPICVCSDPKASENDMEVDESTAYIEYPATTDPKQIYKQYKESNRCVVIFSTYQSIAAVIEAQDLGIPEFDLIICDEAHRTTGAVKPKGQNYYTAVHDNSKVRARKRMYMTATPRIYGEAGKAKAKSESVVLFSMDDEKQYGKQFFRYKFSEAITEDMLCDYKVIVLTVDSNTVPPNVMKILGPVPIGQQADYCRIWGCLNSMKKNVDNIEFVDGDTPMKSAVAFTSTIKDSKLLAQQFNKIAQTSEKMPVEAKHIDGGMDAAQRDKLLNWLKHADSTPRVLSNVRCLSEGVDVPALDAVIFFGKKNSQIDIIQSVGRVMRKAPGKQCGYIIVPIIVNSDEDPEAVLDNSPEFSLVWSVLRALRAHDDRLTFEINTIDLCKRSPPHISVGGGFPGPINPPDGPYEGPIVSLDGFIQAFYGKVLTKVGEKDYIENWAMEMGKIIPLLDECLTKICLPEDKPNPDYEKYLNTIRTVVNSKVTDEDAINMLLQQYVTKPIFDKLFGDNDTVQKNSVFNSIETMMNKIDLEQGLSSIQEEMDEFYANVENTLSQIDTAKGRQRTIKAVYEKFYKKAFKKDQEKNGVVYTPGEIVDFILNSVNDILKNDFDKSLSSKGVNILDPFTGTGTFIAHLLSSGLIRKADLERKYKEELFANEITLLAYYIATVNIENTYAVAMGLESGPSFDNIVFTDTFNIENIAKSTADAQTKIDGTAPFGRNHRRIRREDQMPITVIIGNPPYGANQKKANDNAKKRTYKEAIFRDGKEIESVDKRIKNTYLKDEDFPDGKGNVNSVYDNYVRAFRWSTDRLREQDGVIAFVTPNGWLTGSAFIGFRKAIEREFDSIYIYNLRGDQNGSNWREEGEKVFGEGSKVGISITLLARHRDHSSNKAKIRYIQVEDGMKRTAKLASLNTYSSFSKITNQMEILHPKENGDWIIERNSVYKTLIPIAGDTFKKFEKYAGESIFTGYSRGYGTSRDSWVYNFSESTLSQNMLGMIEEYNRQLKNGKRELVGNKIAWDSNLIKLFESGKKVSSGNQIFTANYRPFCKQKFFYNPNLLHEIASMPTIYSNNCENFTICVSGIGVKKDFSCLITNTHTDLELVGKSQCFPLYWYEDPSAKRSSSQKTLYDTSGPIRHDAISDWALETAKKQYGANITKEDIFYYVYGYLHSKDYREAFNEDLKMELPRIDFVSTYEDFKSFSEAGRKLADLHLNYEKAPAWEGLTVNGNTSFNLSDDILKVGTKEMKLDPEKRTLVYNELIVIGNIPEEAFQYIVNGNSALKWITKQYHITTNTDTGIVNNPNEYAGSRYIFDLIRSVITVSVETVKIVDSLPKLDFSQQ